MAHLITTLEGIYNTYFQSPYKVNDNREAAIIEEYGKIPPNENPNSKTVKGIELTKYIGGREVFLPVQFWKSQQLYLEIHCCTVRITSKKTIIRTAVSERTGTIKEQFNVGDYLFTIKGVLIGNNRTFPDEKILKLKDIYETTDTVELYNALTELFMTSSRRVAITDIDFPEKQGGSKYHRPFTLTCESDFVDTLEIIE
jgi:hypothetical protein